MSDHITTKRLLDLLVWSELIDEDARDRPEGYDNYATMTKVGALAERLSELAAPSRDRTEHPPKQEPEPPLAPGCLPRSYYAMSDRPGLQSSEATARPCFNCGLDSTGKMTHSFGCPNAPVFREPAQSVGPQGTPLSPDAGFPFPIPKQC